MVSWAVCTAAESSSTQPQSGSLTKRPVAVCKPLQVGRRELHAFLLPLGRDGEPIDAAALDDDPGA